MPRSTLEAKYIYENGFQSKNEFSELLDVALYMRDALNLKPAEREIELQKFLNKYKKVYFSNEYDRRLLKQILNRSKNKSIELIDHKDILIRRNEFEYFDSIDLTYNYRKILFVLYIYYRRSVNYCNEYAKKPKEGYSINIELKQYKKIKKSMKILLNNKEKDIDNIIFNLNQMGYIRTDYKSLMILDFIKEGKIKLDEESEAMCEIKDFSAIGWYFDKMNGQKLIKYCSLCESLFKDVKSNNSKYCKKCTRDSLKEGKAIIQNLLR